VQALELIAEVNAGESNIRVRWVWLDAKPGEVLAPMIVSRSDVLVSLRTGALIEGTSVRANRFYAYYPVATGGLRLGGLELSQPIEVLSQRAMRVYDRSVMLLLALFLAAVMTVYLVGVRLIGRPLAKLTKKIDRVGQGDLSDPVELRGRNELTALAQGLNTMCERLAQSQAKIAEETAAKSAAVEQSRHADRLRTVGQLASGVAHELGTPLNVVGGRAALISEDRLDESQVKESAKIITAQVDRMTTIIRQLLVFARRGTTAKEKLDVEQAARQSLTMVETVASARHITVDLSADQTGKAVVECSPSALQQVMTNLLVNAIQASPRGSRVRVGIVTRSVTPPDDFKALERRCVVVEVRDSGKGIAEEDLGRVFEPFFTTKEIGEGTGLGLSIVHGILREHDGWITVASDPGVGSCFTFYLPVSEA